jgi:hypothetical protein
MDSTTARALADGYVAYIATGDTSVLRMFSSDFYDNVSQTRGLGIFDVVSTWLDVSFADRSVELHQVTHSDDIVMIWFTAHGRHVGNGFPRLEGLPVNATSSLRRRSTSSGLPMVWSWSTGPSATTPPCWTR